MMNTRRFVTVLVLGFLAATEARAAVEICYTDRVGGRHWFALNKQSCRGIQEDGPWQVRCYENLTVAPGTDGLIGPGGGIRVATVSDISVEVNPRSFVVKAFRKTASGRVKETPLFIDLGGLGRRHTIAVGASVQSVPTVAVTFALAAQSPEPPPVLVIEVLILDSTLNVIERRLATFDVATWKTNDKAGLTRAVQRK
jgi:hypothetical protein